MVEKFLCEEGYSCVKAGYIPRRTNGVQCSILFVSLLIEVTF